MNSVAAPTPLTSSHAPSIGALVRTRRKGLGLTQRALADAVGVDFTYISKIENGKTTMPPSAELLGWLELALGCEDGELLAISGRTVTVPVEALLELREAYASRRFEWIATAAAKVLASVELSLRHAAPVPAGSVGGDGRQ